MVINFFYQIFFLKDRNLRLDFTSRVEGVDCIITHKKISAGKYFWIGAYKNFGKNAYSPKIVFKGNFIASNFCHIGAINYIEIGNNVLFGSKVYVTDHGHGIYEGVYQSSPLEPPSERSLGVGKKVIINDNVWVGDNVVVLPGVTIGEGSVIGANSVVCSDIPEFCIAVGVPAKVIKKYDFTKKSWIRL